MSKDSNILLSIRDLTMMYGGRVGCQDVCFDLWPGEVLGIVGESGSGKSTLLNCISAQLEPTEGQVSYNTRIEGMKEVYRMSEPERRLLMRTDWPLFIRTPGTGLE